MNDHRHGHLDGDDESQSDGRVVSFNNQIAGGYPRASPSSRAMGEPGRNSSYSRRPMQAPQAASEQLLMGLDLDEPLEDVASSSRYQQLLPEVEQILHYAVMRVMGGRLLQVQTVGGAGLGICLPHGTVDILAVVQGVERDMFFASLSMHFEGIPDMCFTRHHPSAYLPTLKFQYKGTDFNLLHMQVPWSEMPSLEALSEPGGECLGALEQDSVWSLYAWQISQSFQEIVPNYSNFQLTLRLVKLWAQHRGIYGSMYGYPSGVAWAICVARICQMYPSSGSSQLASRFFRIYDRWDWLHAVDLAMGNGAKQPSWVTQTRVNGIGNDEDERRDHMIVLTPTTEPFNSTESVTKSSMQVLRNEFHRGYQIVLQVEQGKARWEDLYVPSRFFERHKHYLRVDLLARSRDVFEQWAEWGEICCMTLVKVFEETMPETSVRAWPQRFKFNDPNWPCACAICFGLHFDRSKSAGFKSKEQGKSGEPKSTYDLREPVVRFLDTINTWSERDRYAGQFEMMLRHVRRRELQRWASMEVIDGAVGLGFGNLKADIGDREDGDYILGAAGLDDGAWRLPAL